MNKRRREEDERVNYFATKRIRDYYNNSYLMQYNESCFLNTRIRDYRINLIPLVAKISPINLLFAYSLILVVLVLVLKF